MATATAMAMAMTRARAAAMATAMAMAMTRARAAAMALALALVAVLGGMGAGGCSETGPSLDELDQAERPARPHPLYDLEASRRAGGFFDHPFPADIRLTARGAPDLRGFPRLAEIPLLDAVRRAVTRDVRGFSPQGALYLRFSAPLQRSSLPANPTESLGPAASVYLVNVDPRSDHRGERHPVHVSFRRHGGRFFAGNTLVARPAGSLPLRGDTRYALVVTRDVRGLAGLFPRENPEFTELLREYTPPGRVDEWEALGDLAEWLRESGAPHRVLVATVFTTADHPGDLRRIRAWMLRHLPPPRAVHWELLEETDEFVLYEGRFPLMELTAGIPPYSHPNDGVIRFDGAREPLPGRIISARFALSVPVGAPPPQGWPLVTFAHGSGGTYRNFVPLEAEWAASVGVAMLSMDNPLHGARAVGDRSFEEHLRNLALWNPGAGRDLFRAGALDHAQLVRLATTGLTVPAEVTPSGEPVRLDTRRLGFVGHSLGAQYGALLLAMEPEVRAAVLSAAGGGFTTALLFREVAGVPLQRLLSDALGLDPLREPLNADHPVTSLLLQTLFDAADPLVYARGVIREPAGPPPHVLMTAGLRDSQTPPRSTERLAQALGLPALTIPAAGAAERRRAHAGPRRHQVWGGWRVAQAPKQLFRNVHVGPYPVTGGLLRFPDRGHDALYLGRGMEDRLERWLHEATRGAPTLRLP
jgi:predicted esterase